MLRLFSTIFVFCFALNAYNQNQNISQGNIFDGEPYLVINPNNSQHMVIAWMGFTVGNQISIRTRVTFDAGESWSPIETIPHAVVGFTSADPCLAFNNDGYLYLSYIDYNSTTFSGAVRIRKSIDGGLSWENSIEVISVSADPGKRCIDRPWMAIDNSNGPNQGTIYITTMNAKGVTNTPFNPYLSRSHDYGQTWEPWRYLDSLYYLAGDLIAQPMPFPVVTSSGEFHAVYPSYVPTQNIFPRYILASSETGGISVYHQQVYAGNNSLNDTLAKKGYVLISDPSSSDHLGFVFIADIYGDGDVFFIETYNNGDTWSLPYRVNDDPVGNNRMQDMVWADFDYDGDLVVSWRDRRNSVDTSYSAATEIWAAVREEGSSTFLPNFQISTMQVQHNDVLNESGNDFMCVKYFDDTLSTCWGDVRDGSMNIWFQRILPNGEHVSIHQISSESLFGIEIYPNPTSTSISISGENVLSYSVVDINGKLIPVNAVNNNKLDVSQLAPGIYFLSIQTSNGTVQKKFVVE